MEYQEVSPSPALRDVVQCTWFLRDAPEAAGRVEAIFPDGRGEIVVNHADRFAAVDEPPGTLQPRSIAVGQMREPLRIAPTGTVDLAGVRLRPAGLWALLGVPMTELTGRRIDLDALDPALRRDLDAAARRRGGDAVRAERIEAVLLRRLHHRRRPSDAVVRAIAAIERSGGRIRIDDLADGLSARTLERRFAREVGLPPKVLARIVRFQGVLRRVEHTAPIDWARLAIDGGYFDQAHLIRDFRELAGTSPERYRRDVHAMSDRFVHGS